MCRRPRLKIVKRHHRKNCTLNGKPNHNPWRRHIRPVFAGTTTDDSAAKEKRESYAFKDVPADRKSSQASTTRLAMPASATFPQARGSYAFLLPTSPSILSTPS